MTRPPVTLTSEATFVNALLGATEPLLAPVVQTIPLVGRSAVRLYSAFRESVGFLLESVEGPGGLARHSFIIPAPRLAVRLREDRTELCGEPDAIALTDDLAGATVIERLRDLCSRFKLADLPAPRLAAGFVGSFSYEFAAALHRTCSAGPEGRTDEPLARLYLTSDLLVIDHLADSCSLVTAPIVTPGDDLATVYADALARLATMVDWCDEVPPEDEPAPDRRDSGALDPGPASPGDRAAFEAAVSSARAHVHAGDCLQVVVSRRIDRPFSGDPLEVYRALRARNPGPYLYLVEEGDRAVVGASPEMLLRVEGRRVTTVPIAGTRPRGATPDDDDALAAELLADEKERAEHLMLVDLARNDLGRVAATGSVTVGPFMEVERYSHVQHLVSTVTATLRDDCDRFDALAACFPAGTVSGAPNLRAMSIIEALEPAPRGVYAGAVGYLDLAGTMDLAIAIRTAVLRDGVASVQVGAGIVADSVPAREYEETGVKALGVLSALAAAEAVP